LGIDLENLAAPLLLWLGLGGIMGLAADCANLA